MRMTRKIALILALCLLTLAPLQALAEEGDIQYEMMEAEVAPAEFAGDGTGLEIEEEGETDLPGLPGEEVQTDDGIDDGEGYAIDAPLSDMYYARTACGDAPVYCDELTLDALGALSAGEVVLVTGAGFGLVNVAMNAGGSVIEGYMEPSALAPLEPWEADAYLDAAATGEVALYAGDLNWPLGRLGEASAASLTDLMASSNYTEYGNDTTYTINGKTIYACMFPDTGAGNCWAWAQKVYLELWGVHFNSTFEGTAATGLNMLRNLSDAELDAIALRPQGPQPDHRVLERRRRVHAGQPLQFPAHTLLQLAGLLQFLEELRPHQVHQVAQRSGAAADGDRGRHRGAQL